MSHPVSHRRFPSILPFNSLSLFYDPRFLRICVASIILWGMFSGAVGAEPVGTDEFRSNNYQEKQDRPWATHAAKYPACADIISTYQMKTDEIYALYDVLRWAVRPEQLEIKKKYDALVAERQKINKDVRACIQKEATKPRESRKNTKQPKDKPWPPLQAMQPQLDTPNKNTPKKARTGKTVLKGGATATRAPIVDIYKDGYPRLPAMTGQKPVGGVILKIRLQGGVHPVGGRLEGPVKVESEPRTYSKAVGYAVSKTMFHVTKLWDMTGKEVLKGKPLMVPMTPQ